MQKPLKKNQQVLFLVGSLILILVLILIISLVIFKKPKSSVPSVSPPTSSTEQLPTSQDFDEVVFQLNTSKTLIDYLNQNFIIEERNQSNPLMPKEFFEAKKGTQWDFAVFTTYVLWKNHYDSSIIRYKYGEGKINAVVVFRDKDLPKTIVFTSKEVFMYPHGWSFEEMFQKEEERIGEKITEYAVSYWTDKGELWPENWRKR